MYNIFSERFLSNPGGNVLNVEHSGDIKCNPCHLIFEVNSNYITHNFLLFIVFSINLCLITV